MPEKASLAKNLGYAIAVLALVIYGIVQTLQPGQKNMDIEIERRLSVLETCMKSMTALPNDVSGIKVSIDQLSRQIDKIEKKLDQR